jgi:hypothetical protein
MRLDSTFGASNPSQHSICEPSPLSSPRKIGLYSIMSAPMRYLWLQTMAFMRLYLPADMQRRPIFLATS